MSRWLRRGAGCLLGMVALVTTSVASSLLVAASTASVAVDRQAYVIDYGPDPYQDSDLHIAVTGGEQTTHSVLHIGAGQMPAGSTLMSLRLTLIPNQDARANIG